ncbi:MAG: type II toxin-antitoxin system HicA family toxin [Acidimicrobiia bacterium]|nr:type II toxin-antitoxin system HicA family toxin [Acidimicrobiia bacterium]
MKPRRLLRRLQEAENANVRFSDLVRLMEACGFELKRTRGSHHVFAHPELTVILNLQEVRGQAKPYQVRQVARTIIDHGLTIEGSL